MRSDRGHEFDPNYKGQCKECGQAAFADVHMAWESREPETLDEKLRDLRERLQRTSDGNAEAMHLALIELIGIMEAG